MKENEYVMSIDEGTSSLRTCIIDKKGNIISSSQREFKQIYPQSGWVEHDANEIWGAQLSTIKEAKLKYDIKTSQIKAIGITNQRETIVAWNKKTGLPVYNAIVWQDLRTTKYCDELIAKGYNKIFQEKTGLIINSYFSGTKIKWILDNVPTARRALENNELIVGTIDSWIIWNLTKGEEHVTDVTNASRTLLYNIKENKWDDEILNILGIPKSILPSVKPSGSIFGKVSKGIFSNNSIGGVPISGVLGDQQSSLFGHLGFEKGDIKNTYGTGNFILMNIGEEIKYSKNNLLTTIAWQLEGRKPIYALEGSVFIAGAAITWLKEGLQLIYDSSFSDKFAELIKEEDNQNIVFVPALSGLGAPYWDSTARGAIFGLERATKREHLIRATLEGVAHRSNDLIVTMYEDSKIRLKSLKVDGGACKSNYMMQYQSSISNLKIERPQNTEVTCMGAAYIAGLTIKFWKDVDELKQINKIDRIFEPNMPKQKILNKKKYWKKAIEKTKGWQDD